MPFQSKTKPHDLVLIHGWGMNSGIWQPLQVALESRFRIHLLNLPGHGSLANGLNLTISHKLSDWAAEMVKSLPDRAIWLGWSLGGLVALNIAADYPDKVRQLILVASTPKFVQSEDWLSAVEPSVFNDFELALQADPGKLMQRFLSLQVSGTTTGRSQTLKHLKSIYHDAEPSELGLIAGLQILQNSDLRFQLQALNCPAAVVLGEFDKLVPLNVINTMTDINAALKTYVIKGGAHVPFLSHTEDFLKVIMQELAYE